MYRTASATVLAGVRRVSQDGLIDPAEEIVVVATGSGFKEFGSGSSVDTETVSVSDLDRRFEGLLD